MSDESRPGWVGQRAVAWVIDDAPVPADLAWTLVVIARRCDDNGRGSYQSAQTIAEKTGKSAKQAQRDIAQLRELGLIVRGDQSLVAHLPVGQRPVVYDLPLHLRGPKPAKESRNKSGLKKNPDDTTPTDGTPPMHGTPPTDGESTPPMDAPGTPPMHGDQRTPMNNPVEKRSGVECTPSTRFAPSGAGDSELTLTLTLEPTAPRGSNWTDWRAEDLQRLINVLGTDQVHSTGGKAGKEGNYSAFALYNAMQKMPGGDKDWPGKYLEAMQARGGDSAVDAWLDGWDMERA